MWPNYEQWHFKWYILKAYTLTSVIHFFSFKKIPSQTQAKFSEWLVKSILSF